MSPRCLVCLVWLAAGPVAELQVPTPEDWRRADRGTARLDPDAFRELPAEVRHDLGKRRCKVPQVSMLVPPNNVVRGRFRTATQEDWAVLCSHEGVSSILVYWNGSASDPSELASDPDRNYLQVVLPGRIGYSRHISVATPELVHEGRQVDGAPELPPPDHDGIHDAFVEKASVVWYWSAGEWLQLTGLD